MNFLEDITDQLNLRWAWEKVRKTTSPGDVWINETELAGFEVQLKANLKLIAADLSKGRYSMRPLRPMAFPKNPNKDGSPQVRPYFNISIRDQVAWTAVVNVIGPHLDAQMPAWSYGSRLFRSIWVDDEDGVNRRKIGRYRHSSGRIYLPFGQGWPVFRRHVFLATSAMNNNAESAASWRLTDEDSDELALQEQLQAEHRCPFVRKEYWHERKPDGGKDELYWCSIDLEKFYPSMNLQIVHRTIIDFLPIEYKIQAEELIASMLDFKVDTIGWSKNDLDAISLRAGQKSYNGIPTGLYVSGFLANVALLKVDLDVVNRLKTKNVAHFRFVDDHIILAYNFEDLISWVDEYIDLLATSNTGAKVNPEKVEPLELSAFIRSRKRSLKRTSNARENAVKSCKLNPEFPSPLMTKTLALVSAIARTDFNLLEQTELVAMTDQLEHMLLVDLPESEIPEKTRLSFAAVRLMRIAQCRLANDHPSVKLGCQQEALCAEQAEIHKQLAKPLIDQEKRNQLIGDADRLKQKIEDNEASIKKQHEALEREVAKAFGLLRKVLQERPDRVRLWTRAVQMCRQTGVSGISRILEDIERVNKDHNNPLASEYLMGNTIALLGAEVVTAARIICDFDAAEWRKRAAYSFLHDISKAPLKAPKISPRTWFLETSWNQLCFGVFCADLILKTSKSVDHKYIPSLPNHLVKLGEMRLGDLQGLSTATSLAWWAVRPTLNELSSRAPRWVLELISRLPSTSDTHALWRFFPSDVPSNILHQMSVHQAKSRRPSHMAGWWHDALIGKQTELSRLVITHQNNDVARALKNIKSASTDRFISLQQWCEHARLLSNREVADPRVGEWTALEIVRQIGTLISPHQTFSIKYVLSARAKKPSAISLHPANYRVPRAWLDDIPPTWSQWRELIRPHGSNAVTIVPERIRISDSRYTPISSRSPFFESINQTRGLGLLLYCLLKHSFELPCHWNGPGHRDVLSQLPKLLLQDVTCSSWTLGVLESCLQPRAMENIFFRSNPALSTFLDDDSLHDPIHLLSATQVCKAIAKCQSVLEDNQISTIDHRARQLTPISIRLLSRPNWATEFSEPTEAENGNEH